jgi:hypothetical protein
MRLRRADPDSAGIRTLRRDRGFQYLDASSESFTDPEVIGRIKDLVIPPAWGKVWICPDDNGLARILRRLLPAEREVAGLLGLMLLIHARHDARTRPDVEIVLLDDLNRSRWTAR